MTKQIVEGLHSNWSPHPGQAKAAHELFYKDNRSIFIQCGRKWGKTEFAIYVLWRWAIYNPGTSGYYIAPLLKQAREIVWADPRLPGFGPRQWLLDGSEGINNTEMRLRFRNGSFIKIDGSDNYEKHRGTRPGILVYEEFKDHRKQFRDVMRPNLAVHNAPEIFIGTPPEDRGNESENEFLKVADEHKGQVSGMYFHYAPTWENPHVSKDWLRKEKARLVARGEADIWEREYAARFVKGGAHKIFPMFGPKFIKKHSEIELEIKRDRRKLEWFVCADPAAASVFAVLYLAINPYSKKIYAMDEIYATEQSEMSVKVIGANILEKRKALHDYPLTPWRMIYDEAETWFSSEMLSHYDEYFEPTQKMKTDKVTGLSLIKDLMLEGKLVVSDRCPKFYWELDSYCKDSRGHIPKKHDHLIDCFRYILAASFYDLNDKMDPDFKEKIDDDFRGEMLSRETYMDDYDL